MYAESHILTVVRVDQLSTGLGNMPGLPTRLQGKVWGAAALRGT